MENLIIAVFLTALAGLGTITFRSPELGRKILLPTIVITGFLWIIMNAFSLGYFVASVEAKGHCSDSAIVKQDCVKTADAISKNISTTTKKKEDFFFNLNMYLWVALGSLFVLMILSWVVESHNRNADNK